MFNRKTAVQIDFTVYNTVESHYALGVTQRFAREPSATGEINDKSLQTYFADSTERAAANGLDHLRVVNGYGKAIDGLTTFTNTSSDRRHGITKIPTAQRNEILVTGDKSAVRVFVQCCADMVARNHQRYPEAAAAAPSKFKTRKVSAKSLAHG